MPLLMLYLPPMQLFAPAQPYLYQARTATLAEHLGYERETKLAIIGADDFGLCDSVNEAIVELARAERITSTSLLVPGAAAHAATRAAQRFNIACGLHLTFNSDFTVAPIRPVSPAAEFSSLTDESGFLSLEVEGFVTRAQSDEIEREALAQIDKALADGLEITHLDSHEGTLQLNEKFIDLYFALAARYRLPPRAGSTTLLRELGLDAEWLNRAHTRGLHFPDNLVYIPLYAFETVSAKERYLEKLIADLPPGVNEFYFHPALDSEEVRRLLPTSPQAQTLPDPELAWQVRVN
ncbi:MAG: ChbG/HpnK family deacetylase, partial [bacterium]